MKEVVPSNFSKHEEDLAKGRGPSRLGEELKYRQEGRTVKGMSQTVTGPLLLALRFGEVYWSLSEAGHAQTFRLFVTPTPTRPPGEMGHF